MASSLDEKSGWGLFFQPRRSSIGRLVEPYAAVLVMDGQHRNFCDYYRAQSQGDRNIPTRAAAMRGVRLRGARCRVGKNPIEGTPKFKVVSTSATYVNDF